MNKITIGPRDLREALKFTSEVVAKEESRLNSLDAAIGDGDHGITVRIGFQAIRHTIENIPDDADISAILGYAGRAFMSATGGAIGVILGRMLMCGEKALKGCGELGAVEFRCWLEAMESTISAVGKAKPGDKTILDAVNAATAAISIWRGHNLVEVLKVASQAADKAARDTANMICKVGRASRLGERSLGQLDPGAVTFSIILDSFYRWLSENSLKGSAF